MKKRFTLITAAMMLLVFLTPPCFLTAENQQVMKNIGFEENVLALPDRGGEPMRDVWTWTASSGDLGDETPYSASLNGKAWTVSRDAVLYTGWSSSCIQLGKKDNPETVTLSSSAFPGTISSVAVECSSYGGNHSISITVGESTFLSSTATSSWTTVGTKTGTGSASGEIVISFTHNSSARALYIKSISVTYSVGSTYTVTYDANGGTGEVPTDGLAYANGASVTVKDRNTLDHATLGFKGWNTAADGTGTFYNPGDTFTMGSSNLTLYAVYSTRCTFAYNGNGKTNGDVPTGYYTSYGSGAKVTVLDNTGSLEKTNSVWEGWNTAADGSGSTYVADDNFIITANTTLYAKWRELNTYTLVTNVNQIVPGKHYIIASSGAENDDAAKAMGLQNSNNRAAVTVKINNHEITETAGVYEFVIIGPDVDGFYTIYDANAPGYLYAASSSANQLKTQAVIDNNARWNISFDGGTGIASVVATNSSNNRNVMQFNSSSSLFACYASASQSPVYLYAKNGEATTTFKKSITGYGSNAGGYYLIASPVGQVTPSTTNCFITATPEDYDLYYFDQSQPNGKWRNYKNNAFNLVSGKGYLYAHKTDTVLRFEGYPYIGSGEVPLAYPADPEGLLFPGLNLIGNPLNTTATLNKAFYKMNAEGSGFVAQLEGSGVALMEGVFVRATAQNQIAKFTATRGSQRNSIAKADVNVISSNGTIIDNTIVRFDNGQTLEKFMLDENGTKLYVPMNGKEYAIVNAQAKGKLPVNFKAAENGTYTLSFEVEDTEMSYLHLIDKLTGNDIDLLATPEYTFSAKSGDSENRFRLVFEANGNALVTSNEPFAYFNGSEWVIENDGNATLQVIDVMGRMLRSENVSGNATTSLPNLSAGVYVLRLVNSESIRTQKVVIE